MPDEEIVVSVESPPEQTDLFDGKVVVEEKPRGPDGRFVAKEATPEEPVDDLADQFKALKEQSERDRQARDEAERRATQARQEAERARAEATTARSEIADSHFETIKSSIEAAQVRATAAEAEYKTAYEAGDVSAMAAAQRKMARSEAEILRFEEAKSSLESRKSEPERRPAERSGDHVEEFISGRTSATQKWLRDHPDHARAIANNMAGRASTEETRKARKMNAAHEDALAEGIEADTPQYFEHVERFLGLTVDKPKPDPAPAPEPAPQRTSRRTAVPVAPVAQSGGGTTGNSGTEVRLTAGEAAAATDGTLVWNWSDPNGKFKKGDPIGIQEMARRKLEMKKQGLYDRAYIEQ